MLHAIFLRHAAAYDYASAAIHAIQPSLMRHYYAIDVTLPMRYAALPLPRFSC